MRIAEAVAVVGVPTAVDQISTSSTSSYSIKPITDVIVYDNKTGLPPGFSPILSLPGSNESNLDSGFNPYHFIAISRDHFLGSPVIDIQIVYGNDAHYSKLQENGWEIVKGMEELLPETTQTKNEAKYYSLVIKRLEKRRNRIFGSNSSSHYHSSKEFQSFGQASSNSLFRVLPINELFVLSAGTTAPPQSTLLDRTDFQEDAAENDSETPSILREVFKNYRIGYRRLQDTRSIGALRIPAAVVDYVITDEDSTIKGEGTRSRSASRSTMSSSSISGSDSQLPPGLSSLCFPGGLSFMVGSKDNDSPHQLDQSAQYTRGITIEMDLNSVLTDTKNAQIVENPKTSNSIGLLSPSTADAAKILKITREDAGENLERSPTSSTASSMSSGIISVPKDSDLNAKVRVNVNLSESVEANLLQIPSSHQELNEIPTGKQTPLSPLSPITDSFPMPTYHQFSLTNEERKITYVHCLNFYELVPASTKKKIARLWTPANNVLLGCPKCKSLFQWQHISEEEEIPERSKSRPPQFNEHPGAVNTCGRRRRISLIPSTNSPPKVGLRSSSASDVLGAFNQNEKFSAPMDGGRTGTSNKTDPQVVPSCPTCGTDVPISLNAKKNVRPSTMVSRRRSLMSSRRHFSRILGTIVDALPPDTPPSPSTADDPIQRSSSDNLSQHEESESDNIFQSSSPLFVQKCVCILSQHADARFFSSLLAKIYINVVAPYYTEHCSGNAPDTSTNFDNSLLSQIVKYSHHILDPPDMPEVMVEVSVDIKKEDTIGTSPDLSNSEHPVASDEMEESSDVAVDVQWVITDPLHSTEGAISSNEDNHTDTAAEGMQRSMDQSTIELSFPSSLTESFDLTERFESLLVDFVPDEAEKTEETNHEIGLRIQDLAPAPLPLTPGCEATLLVRSFSPEALQTLFTLIILEQRVLFHSCRPQLISPILRGLSSLVFPLQWCGAQVPSLPAPVADTLDCPTPFLFGTSTSLLPSLSKLPPDIFLADIDRGAVTLGWCNRPVVLQRRAPQPPGTRRHPLSVPPSRAAARTQLRLTSQLRARKGIGPADKGRRVYAHDDGVPGGFVNVEPEEKKEETYEEWRNNSLQSNCPSSVEQDLEIQLPSALRQRFEQRIARAAEKAGVYPGFGPPNNFESLTSAVSRHLSGSGAAQMELQLRQDLATAAAEVMHALTGRFRQYVRWMGVRECVTFLESGAHTGQDEVPFLTATTPPRSTQDESLEPLLGFSPLSRRGNRTPRTIPAEIPKILVPSAEHSQDAFQAREKDKHGPHAPLPPLGLSGVHANGGKGLPSPDLSSSYRTLTPAATPRGLRTAPPRTPRAIALAGTLAGPFQGSTRASGLAEANGSPSISLASPFGPAFSPVLSSSENGQMEKYSLDTITRVSSPSQVTKAKSTSKLVSQLRLSPLAIDEDINAFRRSRSASGENSADIDSLSEEDHHAKPSLATSKIYRPRGVSANSSVISASTGTSSTDDYRIMIFLVDQFITDAPESYRPLLSFLVTSQAFSVLLHDLAASEQPTSAPSHPPTTQTNPHKATVDRRQSDSSTDSTVPGTAENRAGDTNIGGTNAYSNTEVVERYRRRTKTDYSDESSMMRSSKSGFMTHSIFDTLEAAEDHRSHKKEAWSMGARSLDTSHNVDAVVDFPLGDTLTSTVRAHVRSLSHSSKPPLALTPLGNSRAGKQFTFFTPSTETVSQELDGNEAMMHCSSDCRKMVHSHNANSEDLHQCSSLSFEESVQALKKRRKSDELKQYAYLSYFDAITAWMRDNCGDGMIVDPSEVLMPLSLPCIIKNQVGKPPKVKAITAVTVPAKGSFRLDRSNLVFGDFDPSIVTKFPKSLLLSLQVNSKIVYRGWPCNLMISSASLKSQSHKTLTAVGSGAFLQRALAAAVAHHFQTQERVTTNSEMSPVDILHESSSQSLDNKVAAIVSDADAPKTPDGNSSLTGTPKTHTLIENDPNEEVKQMDYRTPGVEVSQMKLPGGAAEALRWVSRVAGAELQLRLPVDVRAAARAFSGRQGNRETISKEAESREKSDLSVHDSSIATGSNGNVEQTDEKMPDNSVQRKARAIHVHGLADSYIDSAHSAYPVPYSQLGGSIYSGVRSTYEESLEYPGKEFDQNLSSQNSSTQDAITEAVHAQMALLLVAAVSARVEPATILCNQAVNRAEIALIDFEKISLEVNKRCSRSSPSTFASHTNDQLSSVAPVDVAPSSTSIEQQSALKKIQSFLPSEKDVQRALCDPLGPICSRLVILIDSTLPLDVFVRSRSGSSKINEQSSTSAIINVEPAVRIVLSLILERALVISRLQSLSKSVYMNPALSSETDRPLYDVCASMLARAVELIVTHVVRDEVPRTSSSRAAHSMQSGSAPVAKCLKSSLPSSQWRRTMSAMQTSTVELVHACASLLGAPALCLSAWEFASAQPHTRSESHSSKPSFQSSSSRPSVIFFPPGALYRPLWALRRSGRTTLQLKLEGTVYSQFESVSEPMDRGRVAAVWPDTTCASCAASCSSDSARKAHNKQEKTSGQEGLSKDLLGHPARRTIEASLWGMQATRSPGRAAEWEQRFLGSTSSADGNGTVNQTEWPECSTCNVCALATSPALQFLQWRIPGRPGAAGGHKLGRVALVSAARMRAQTEGWVRALLRASSHQGQLLYGIAVSSSNLSEQSGRKGGYERENALKQLLEGVTAAKRLADLQLLDPGLHFNLLLYRSLLTPELRLFEGDSGDYLRELSSSGEDWGSAGEEARLLLDFPDWSSSQVREPSLLSQLQTLVTTPPSDGSEHVRPFLCAADALLALMRTPKQFTTVCAAGDEALAVARGALRAGGLAARGDWEALLDLQPTFSGIGSCTPCPGTLGVLVRSRPAVVHVVRALLTQGPSAAVHAFLKFRRAARRSVMQRKAEEVADSIMKSQDAEGKSRHRRNTSTTSSKLKQTPQNPSQPTEKLTTSSRGTTAKHILSRQVTISEPIQTSSRPVLFPQRPFAGSDLSDYEFSVARGGSSVESSSGSLDSDQYSQFGVDILAFSGLSSLSLTETAHSELEISAKRGNPPQKTEPTKVHIVGTDLSLEEISEVWEVSAFEFVESLAKYYYRPLLHCTADSFPRNYDDISETSIVSMSAIQGYFSSLSLRTPLHLWSSNFNPRSNKGVSSSILQTQGFGEQKFAEAVSVALADASMQWVEEVSERSELRKKLANSSIDKLRAAVAAVEEAADSRMLVSVHDYPPSAAVMDYKKLFGSLI